MSPRLSNTAQARSRDSRTTGLKAVFTSAACCSSSRECSRLATSPTTTGSTGRPGAEAVVIGFLLK